MTTSPDHVKAIVAQMIREAVADCCTASSSRNVSGLSSTNNEWPWQAMVVESVLIDHHPEWKTLLTEQKSDSFNVFTQEDFTLGATVVRVRALPKTPTTSLPPLHSYEVKDLYKYLLPKNRDVLSADYKYTPRSLVAISTLYRVATKDPTARGLLFDPPPMYGDSSSSWLESWSNWANSQSTAPLLVEDDGDVGVRDTGSLTRVSHSSSSSRSSSSTMTSPSSSDSSSVLPFPHHRSGTGTGSWGSTNTLQHSWSDKTAVLYKTWHDMVESRERESRASSQGWTPPPGVVDPRTVPTMAYAGFRKPTSTSTCTTLTLRLSWSPSPSPTTTFPTTTSAYPLASWVTPPRGQLGSTDHTADTVPRTPFGTWATSAQGTVESCYSPGWVFQPVHYPTTTTA